MKQTIKLNEAQLREVVAESVRRVLKETYEEYERNYWNGVIQSLAELADCGPDEIQSSGGALYYTPNGSYYVFPNKEAAEEYVMSESGFDAPNYCKTATEPDYWFKQCKESGADMNQAFPNGQPNYNYIAQYVLDTQGPEWFLAGYDGNMQHLSNGMIAFRED